MANLERKLVRRDVAEFDPDNTLEGILLNVQDLINLYGPDACLCTRTRPYDDNEYLCISVVELETDVEMTTRISLELHYESVRDAHDAREFARLQEKFGVPSIAIE